MRSSTRMISSILALALIFPPAGHAQFPGVPPYPGWKQPGAQNPAPQRPVVDYPPDSSDPVATTPPEENAQQSSPTPPAPSNMTPNDDPIGDPPIGEGSLITPYKMPPDETKMVKKEVQVCVPLRVLDNQWDSPPPGGKMEAFKNAARKMIRDEARSGVDDNTQFRVQDVFDSFDPASPDANQLVTVLNLVSGAHNCPDDSNAYTLTVETKTTPPEENAQQSSPTTPPEENAVTSPRDLSDSSGSRLTPGETAALIGVGGAALLWWLTPSGSSGSDTSSTSVPYDPPDINQPYDPSRVPVGGGFGFAGQPCYPKGSSGCY
jgi:hypothetical protein